MMEESKEIPVGDVSTEDSESSDPPLKRTILPPAGPKEMARSAGISVKKLDMSWTGGRNQVRFVGNSVDNSTPSRFRKGPRKKKV